MSPRKAAAAVAELPPLPPLAEPALLLDVPARSIARKNHGRWHSYRVDGHKVPGVTKITGHFKSGGLAEYPGKACAEYAVNHWETLTAMGPADRLKALYGAQWADRDAAAGRGTEVHALGARLAAGEDVGADVPEELSAHVDSYRDFLDKLEPRLAAPPELLIGNRAVRYCGTLDLIADLGPVPWDGEIIPPARWLLDVKTARSGIFGETALQCCAYANAEVFIAEDGSERPMSWLGVERCGAVHVRRDGWDLFPLDTGPAVWAYFRYLAWLYHQEDARKDWVGSAAGPYRGDPAGEIGDSS